MTHESERDPILTTLRAERKRQGLSQEALAQRIGRSTYQTIWQWEHAVNGPSLPNLRAWAGALGYEVALVVAQAALAGMVAARKGAVK